MIRHKYSRLMLLGLIALGLAIGARQAQGQALSFLRQFGASSLDIASGVAVDSTGVYVVGYRSDSGSNRGDLTLRKYDIGGNEQWTRQFGNPGFNPGVAADATGVYVVGGQGLPGGSAAFTRKYDADGNELWTRQVGASSFETATGVSVDVTGVYVVGLTRGSAGTVDSVVRKYDAGGNELWTRQLGPTRGSNATVAADATGVYAGGASDTDEPFVRKYDAFGNELWTQRFGKNGLVTGVAVDATGVYAVGGLCCDGSTFVRKYDSRGSLLWSRQFSQLSSEVPAGVTVDASGLYVVGTTRHGLPGQCYAGAGDVFVRKYDAFGNELWTRQFGTWASESARGVAVDSTGVYVIGRRDGYPQESSAFLAKLEKTPATVTDSKPRILHECILNAASYIGGGVAPGEIVTIFGSAMGPSELTPLEMTEEGRLATVLAGTRILFNGVPAPLVYVSAERSSAIVPSAVAARRPARSRNGKSQPSVDVQVEYQGVRSDAVTVPLLNTRLGIFTLDASGGGQAAIVNEDGSINSPSNPAPRGSVVAIYATGGGLTDPPGVDGAIAGDTLSKLRSGIGVILTDRDEEFCGGPVGLICAEVLYAGGVPGSITGLVQINARIPPDVPPGNTVPLHVGFTEQVITIAIR